MAIRPTPPSSTTAAAPRIPTLPDAPPTSTAPTTIPTTRSSSSSLFLSVTSRHPIPIHNPCKVALLASRVTVNSL
ncbi:hypothetical protein PR202_gb10177 [Eleusine coracana subsp. coracana]|uniref:Uncharacterized protein n=1 Tax=Eleusine coracana subsp. coracana TaxID=191504 RepID=A0AAV5EJQ3_ELECO|nr:hypothetical protein PR202_gb10177 [Eleusine coracana subsp. coracana]